MVRKYIPGREKLFKRGEDGRLRSKESYSRSEIKEVLGQIMQEINQFFRAV